MAYGATAETSHEVEHTTESTVTSADQFFLYVRFTLRVYPLTGPKIARTAEHSRTGKAIPKGVISQFEAAEAKKDREIEKVISYRNSRLLLKIYTVFFLTNRSRRNSRNATVPPLCHRSNNWWSAHLATVTM